MRAALVFLQDALKVRPEEIKRTSIAFLYLFASIGAFITARITTSSLFLEIPNYKEQLPLTYIGIALTVSFVMSRYAVVERRLRRDHTNTITLVLIIAITLLFRALLSWQPQGTGLVLDNPRHEVYWAFLIWAEVLGNILIVQFWSLIPEIFNSRQAKRLFAIIGGGGVLANIAFGQLVRYSVGLIGTENLLYIIVACLAVSTVAVQMLGRDARADLVAAKERAPARPKTKPKLGSGFLEVFNTRHVQLIAVVIVLTYLVSAMVDYQFKVIVGDSIPGKDARSAYFADFFSYTGIIAAVIQFTLTSRILERFGVLFALVLLPMSMLAGTITVVARVIAPLWAAAFTKGAENVLRYTVNDSTLQLLYLPVPASIRGRAKAIIDGMMKPMSMGAAGFITALLVGTLDSLAGISLGFTLDVYQLGWIVGAALVAWTVALVGLRREYLRSLMSTLHRRRLNFEEAEFQIKDEATLRTLEDALQSTNVGHVLHALELLPHVTRKAQKPLHQRVVELLEHEADEVRVAALTYLARYGSEDRPEVTALLEDSCRDVRAAAILAYCAANKTRSLERVGQMLEDCDRKVQAAAVAGLIRHGGLDGVLSCADLLKHWLNSNDELDRCHAAWVLGEVGVQNFYQPLIPLLADDSEQVRLHAISAAGRLRNGELIEPLLAQLGRPRLNAAAVSALAAFGREIEDVVAQVIADPDRPVVVRSQACKILGRLGDHHSAELLVGHLLSSDLHIRTAAAQALGAITLRLPGITLDRQRINEAIRAETQRWYDTTALAVDLRLSREAALLADALAHRQRLAQSQILSLLGLKYPRETIDLVSRNLRSKQPTTRANAVEVLDNVLEKDEKILIIPIFDDAPIDKTLQAGAEHITLRRAPREKRLEELLTGDDDWLQVCAAVEVAREKMYGLEPQVRRMLESKQSVNRETAIYALRMLLEPERLATEVEPLVDDPEPRVGRYAEFALSRMAAVVG